MKEISSNINKNYKLCIQLASKKYRDKFSLYIIEGYNLIAEAVKRNIEVEAVFVREGLETQIPPEYPEPFILNKKLFDNITQTETSQGIVAIVKKIETSEADFFKICGTGNIVVLDRLQDPGNIGTIIRTAEAAGYKGVIAMKGTGDVYSPKAVRAAAGSIFRMPILYIDDPSRALILMKAAGKKTVGACPDACVCYYETELASGVALIIGNEGGGFCDVFQ